MPRKRPSTPDVIALRPIGGLVQIRSIARRMPADIWRYWSADYDAEIRERIFAGGVHVDVVTSVEDDLLLSLTRSLALCAWLTKDDRAA